MFFERNLKKEWLNYVFLLIKNEDEVVKIF